MGFIALVTSAGAQVPKEVQGTWKLNATKSKFSPGPAPTSMVVTYSPAGDAVKITVDLVPADGAKQHWEMTTAPEGTDAPLTGNPEADTASFKRVDERTGVSTFKKAGKVVATNTRTLSADGKTLTIETKGTTPDGKPRHDVAVFER